MKSWPRRPIVGEAKVGWIQVSEGRGADLYTEVRSMSACVSMGKSKGV